jgi:hypothetical protein
MALLEHGFLRAEGDKTRQQISGKYSEIFALLKDLNDVCHEYLAQAKFNDHNPVEVLAITYFIRGLMTFQSLIVLPFSNIDPGLLPACRDRSRSERHQSNFRNCGE